MMNLVLQSRGKGLQSYLKYLELISSIVPSRVRGSEVISGMKV